jgi:hypothetical protein
VSSEEPECDELSGPQRSDAVVPGGLQTVPLNSVFELLKGGDNSQARSEAYQTLGLLGLSGMTRIIRGSGHPGGNTGFHRVADFTDDLLQPDEEAQRSKRLPCAFGLELKY